MYFLITIFYLGFIGIVAMILFKRHEFKTGKPSVVSRLGRKTDKFLSNSYHQVKFGLSYINKRTFIVVAQWIAYHILLRVRKMYVEVKHQALSNPHSKNVILAVRGRADVKKHGASFFLRRISSEE